MCRSYLCCILGRQPVTAAAASSASLSRYRFNLSTELQPPAAGRTQTDVSPRIWTAIWSLFKLSEINRGNWNVCHSFLICINVGKAWKETDDSFALKTDIATVGIANGVQEVHVITARLDYLLDHLDLEMKHTLTSASRRETAAWLRVWLQSRFTQRQVFSMWRRVLSNLDVATSGGDHHNHCQANNILGKQ